MNDYNKLLNSFELLKLDKMKDYYLNYVEIVTKRNKSLTESLLELTEKEIEYRNERASQIQITVSAFQIRPTLYLNEIVLVTSDGDETSTNPYILSVD